MSPGMAAALGAIGGAAAGFLGGTVITALAVGDVDDDAEVTRFLRAHPEMGVSEGKAAMRNLKTGFAASAAVLGAVVGGALSASVAKNPEQPAA